MSLQIISIILGSLTLASALMVILSKHPVRSVIYLVVTFFFITSMYIMMNAQFLAIVNMIVYAGPMTTRGAQLAAFIAGGSLFLVLITALKDTLILGQSYRESDTSIGLVKELGNLLFSKYIVAFEMTSILFIAAMVGAILLAKREKQIIE
jgi:NADH-quinone oxidoreductase subunit J